MKKYVLTASLVALCCSLFAGWFMGALAPLYADIPDRPQLPTVRPNIDPLIIGHRGYGHVAPENTIPAIQAAIEGGLDYVELDIRLTFDGVPVLMHDADVSRTTDGEGPITRMTFAESQTLDAGSWLASDFAGTNIPTLESALSVANGNICVLADLKGRVNRRLVGALRKFASDQQALCLLVSPLGGSPEVTETSRAEVPAAARAMVDANIRKYREIYNRQYRTLIRYWPEVPIAIRLSVNETPEDVSRRIPSLVALEINNLLAMPSLVEEAHRDGLLTYMRVSKQRETDIVYRTALGAGLDGFFISDVDSLNNFLAIYSAEVH